MPKTLHEIFDAFFDDKIIDSNLSNHIKNNLKHKARPYQIKAIQYLVYYLTNYKKKTNPSQLLFHMATGSGKTLIMAAVILELYRLGYRNFIFFVNTDTIINKTKENFLNSQSSKYLFRSQINIESRNVRIRSVDNFETTNQEDISILFSTIQGLHSKLNNPQENNITFDDFYDKKIVLISDEAHHINRLSKKTVNKHEQEGENTWEHTVSKIFEANAENVMLEFTATLQLSHPAIARKYNSKLLVNYPLKNFRQDRYSKEVQTNQIAFQAIDRALVAVLINQYKKKVFANHGLLIKPVIMMKSKTTSQSAEMEKSFSASIQNLTSKQLEKLKNLQNKTLHKAFAYFSKSNLSNQNIIDELKDDFSEEKIISINSKNDSLEKQISINTLEDKNNEYRVVFAVDKLNEGWDVLNLFDIVRLYDTQNSKNGKAGKTTIQEAQLIGRGARYCPFQLSEEQQIDKRKYDDDIENELRICETLHYHCSHNPKYIQELNKVLKEIGIVRDEEKETKFDSKKNSIPTKIVKENSKVNQEPTIKKQYFYTIQSQNSKTTQEYALNNWGKTLIRKAMSSQVFFYFDNLKQFFPALKSVNDFIDKKEYLAELKITILGTEKEIQNLSLNTKLTITKEVLRTIAEELNA